MKNYLYTGTVRHRRFHPKPHYFEYKLFMLALNLEDLEKTLSQKWFCSFNRSNLVSFYRQDHFGDLKISLEEAIRQLVSKRLNKKIKGPILLVTHLRYLGYVFNPVSFYYCYQEDGQELAAIVAEIHNTPWQERYCYVLDAESLQENPNKFSFQFKKDFHISPFMPMDLHYEWKFSPPGKNLWVHMENYQNDTLIFDATLMMERKPLTSKNLSLALVNFPFMTLKVITGIYYQALKLKLKGVPVFAHPKNYKG